MGGIALPVIAGLAVGIGMIILFALVQLPQHIPKELENRKVTYALDNIGGNVACIVTNSDGTPSAFRIMPENPSNEDALVEFTILAKNAEVSFDESGEFRSSDSGRITVPANTPGTPTELAFYVRPAPNATDISLTLEAQAVDPNDMPLFDVMERATVLFYDDEQTGSYCPRN